VAAGGGVLVDDAAVSPEWIDSTLLPLVTDQARVAAMAAAAATVGEPHADERLADLVQAAFEGSAGR
jgi:UDP-N-acetylglucosamine--N-acetylmuramyl-(pentapeptide) pyrophosphoryl-undecaprenol N-acetylglucosamine transferase